MSEQQDAHRSRIALFGSSFNPPHRGHLAVIQDFLQQRIFDEIWLVPVYQHPFRKDLPPFAERLKLLELLLEDVRCRRAKICRIEEELGKTPSYTFDTVTELHRRHPDTDFFIIAGSDVKADLPMWHRIEELQKIASFHFIPRMGFENSPYPRVSSTEIRDKLRRGESVAELTTDKIAAYLRQHSIYS